MSTTETLALVARGPASAGQWGLEPVVPRPIKDDELLVRIVASGICLADVHFGDALATADNPVIWYPRVLGHEGEFRVKRRIQQKRPFDAARRSRKILIRSLNETTPYCCPRWGLTNGCITGTGYVEQVGRNVLGAKQGDPVLLSYLSCGNCYNCRDDDPAYCTELFNGNFRGERGIFTVPGLQKFDIGGSFFGQSSFAGRAVVKERSVVNLVRANPTEDELKVWAPLGCGVQTGTGAFVNTANVQADQDVAVIGVGGVGMSAIMVGTPSLFYETQSSPDGIISSYPAK